MVVLVVVKAVEIVIVAEMNDTSDCNYWSQSDNSFIYTDHQLQALYCAEDITRLIELMKKIL